MNPAAVSRSDQPPVSVPDRTLTPARESPLPVIVIGGGLAGLSAAYDLVRGGRRVTLLEATSTLGGLARSLPVDGRSIECFYHFICRSDHELVELVRELGLESQLDWHHTRTSCFLRGRLFSFGTFFDLLRFSPVPWTQRLRFGAHVLRSRYRREWKWLDEIPARAWLVENIGEKAYNAIWDPLLRIKFGAFHDRVSAAWLWHRIWRVAASRRSMLERESFGVLRQGSATLIEALARWLRDQPGCVVRTGAPVREIEVRDGRVTGVEVDGEHLAGDTVLSTVPLPVLDTLLPGRTEDYFARARQVPFLGVACLLVSLTRPFSRNFWLNVNDARISFNGVIEITNLNREHRRAGLNLIYIPFYVPITDPHYTKSDAELFAECAGMLGLVNPDFGPDWVREWRVFRAPHAQAVCLTHFADLVPAQKSPLPGLYVSDSSQFYPEDRSLTAAIRHGRLAARLILGEAA